MCGLAGLVRLDGERPDLAALKAAGERLAHRGPDDSGLWAQGPAALAFRRLSILDLEGGHQPMASADGQIVIAFNGEIYNHPALRRELEQDGARTRTRSDTETILLLYEREGAAAFRRLEGMFALAVWDARKAEMLLARDALGIKPLYYAFDGRQLAFASELRALSTLTGERSLDAAGILDYLRFGFVHGPRTALSRAMKLEPGQMLKLDARGLALERFWRLPPRPAAQVRPSLAEAEEEIERLLARSVRAQLLSDVPVGAFLSGGVDSSLVAALMAREAAGRVQTFSIGFSGARAGLDESAAARAVARHLGTEHHELILPTTVLDGISDFARSLDEPIADSAILPTYLLARFARERVKVALSGEGADELFAGYGRYKAAYLSERVSRMPAWSRPLAAAVARRLGRGRPFRDIPLADARAWARANAHADGPAATALCRPEFLREAAGVGELEWLKEPGRAQDLNEALAFDLRTVLCDCLLMKVDKATMAAGLEARVPYLDRTLVERAWSLPAEFKMRGLKGKFILRRIADKHLPRGIAWRRKHGFVVPWEEWVRSSGGAIEGVLGDAALGRSGIFDVARVRAELEALHAGRPGADAGLLFRVAVLGLWLDSLKS